MKKALFPRLAAVSIKKNAGTYLPYMITSTITVAMYYIIHSLSGNPGIENVIGGGTITITLALGNWIVAVFAVIFLFYTNSFLMKSRKKEFGLYNILGLEKKHISRIIGYETIYITAISFILGILLGIVFDKVMFLLVLKIIGAEVPLGFYISEESIKMTLILFSVIFLLIFLNSLRQIYFMKPIELLYGGNVGEREPKAKWLMALLGAICLGAGYFISITVSNPILAIFMFFIAVLLVIIGTFMLFTSGSIVLLKILRKNKKYYYKTKHFISISGMIYRMKQNAAGLSNICILSTMVLVMISATLSMQVGVEECINSRYPFEISVYSDYEESEQLDSVIKSELANNKVEAEDVLTYSYMSFIAYRQGNKFITDSEKISYLSTENAYNLVFIPLKDYNNITGKNINLESGEVLLCYDIQNSKVDYDSFEIFGLEFKLIGQSELFVKNGLLEVNILNFQYIIVKDIDELYKLNEFNKIENENDVNINTLYGFNFSGDESVKTDVYNKVKKALEENELRFTIESRTVSRGDFVSVYGGLFFLGIFLGTLFIMAAILIIYYKQISEGHQDKKRFEIMQKVGLSHAEVKKTINSQILTVFFLPLIMAGIHVAFAFPAVSRILRVLNLVNTNLYIICTLIFFAVFSLMYVFIYLFTAKAYYKVVRKS